MAKYGSGDDGLSVYMASGERIWKDDVFFHAVGDLDELNSFVGLARTFVRNIGLDDIDSLLKEIQNHLLVIGGVLNTIGSKYYEDVPKLGEEDVKFLEEQIEGFERELPPLKGFILPSGSGLASILHICRTVCRRAERSVVAFYRKKKFPEVILKYLNRLSTLFFLLARYINYIEGVEEEVWRA